MRIGFLTSHPIQYQAPLFRALAERCDLQVLFAHRQDAEGQASHGYGVKFDWDVDLLSGYASRFLDNAARPPSVSRFFGCRSTEIDALIRDGGFDGLVVAGWNLFVYWQAIRACRRYGVKVLARGDSQLMTPRSRLLRVAKRLIYPSLLKRFDGFLAVGSRNAEYLRHYGVPSVRIYAAPHVVDCQRFAAGAQSSAAERMALQKRLRLPVGRAVVLFVGRLIPWKRVDDIIRAIAQLGSAARPVLLLAGDGPERERLQSLADAAGVTLVFAGFVNQAALPMVYALADVLVLASASHETWGLVVNEAIASGTPVLVADAVGCADELAIPGLTGGRFPVGDCPAMAKAMREILDRGRASYAEALADKARGFSPEQAAVGIVAALTTVTSERTRA